ncbi:hypothetical protein WDV93_21985 [Pantoea ananatis]
MTHNARDHDCCSLNCAIAALGCSDCDSSEWVAAVALFYQRRVSAAPLHPSA